MRGEERRCRGKHGQNEMQNNEKHTHRSKRERERVSSVFLFV